MNNEADLPRRAVGRVMDWTEQEVETLKAMWLSGVSASRIAAAFGNGCTRNAIIGKVHRMALSRSETTPEAIGAAKEFLAAQPIEDVPPPPVVAPEPAIGILIEAEPEPDEAPSIYEIFGPFPGVRIVDLKPDSCRYIAGDPVDAIYCGLPATNDSSWCVEHRALCGGRRYSMRVANANYKQRAKALATVLARG